jgi:hypothetical protein
MVLPIDLHRALARVIEKLPTLIPTPHALRAEQGGVMIEARKGGRWRTLVRPWTRQGRMFVVAKRLDSGRTLGANATEQQR